MASMVSLRNRLAIAPSPSSPVRSRYSQAIWKDSSSNWESEMLMGGKRIRAARVPRHLALRRTLPALDRQRLGAKDHVAENVGLRCFQAIAGGEMRIPPIASECVVQGRN